MLEPLFRLAAVNGSRVAPTRLRARMNEEQFVSIDLDDDNVCSVCKLGTERETLSFCHVCFELNIEGSGGAPGALPPAAQPRGLF